jgi:hypothetical protein
LETVRAQNWTVPVALTPKDPDVGVGGVVPEDEQPAAASSKAAATPVKILPLKSFIALACLFSLREWLGAREDGSLGDARAAAPRRYPVRGTG